jgi:hypothetical protein
MHVSAPSLLSYNSSTDLPSELPANLRSSPLIWVHLGGLVPPLQPLYDSPYAVLRRGLKACTAADATPGSPRCHGRLPGSHQGGPAATNRVSFSDPLVSSPSPSAPPRDGPGNVFLPSEEVFAHQEAAAHHRCHRHGTRPVNRHRHRGWTSDLCSSQPRPELGGSPVDTCLHP